MGDSAFSPCYSGSGGWIGSGVALDSAELYNPATGVWTTTGSLNQGRMGHTAILLPNRKILVAGGNSQKYFYKPDPLNSAELYHSDTGARPNTGPLLLLLSD